MLRITYFTFLLYHCFSYFNTDIYYISDPDYSMINAYYNLKINYTENNCSSNLLETKLW